MKVLLVLTLLFCINSWADEIKIQLPDEGAKNKSVEIKADDLSEEAMKNGEAMDNSKFSKEDRDIDRFEVFLEVRANVKGGKVPIYKQPKKVGRPAHFLNPGDIVVIKVSGNELEERERAEKQDKGTWQKITVLALNNKLKTYYFYDYWRDFIQMVSSSRGVSVVPSAKDNYIEVFTDVPQKSKYSCDSRKIHCFRWQKEYGFIYITDSVLVESQNLNRSTKREMVYFSRFVNKEDGENRWARGWLKQGVFKSTRDIESCIRERCITQGMLDTHPEDVRGFFIELGLIKRPKLKERTAGDKFAVTKAFSPGKGPTPFNRWLNKMNVAEKSGSIKKSGKQEDPLDRGRDEVEYLFKIRPVYELGAGVGYFNLDQSGDGGSYKASEVGLNVNGGVVFPIFLDFELQVTGDISLPILQSNDNIDYTIPSNIVNDLMWAMPIFDGTSVLYLGPGVNFRTIFTSDTDIGYRSLFGGHFSFGYYSPSYFANIHFGFTGRDFNTSSSDTEWSIQLGVNKDSKKEKIKRRSFFLRVMGYTYNDQEIDLITDEITRNQFKILQGSVNYQWEL